jgi:branched-chain amino acid transport system permease protein
MLSADIVLQVLWTSVANASYQALYAIAFALVLKVTKIWNFTQPALVGVAFYATYAAIILAELPVWIGVALGFIPTIALAVGIERYAFQVLRARRSDTIAFFIFSLIFAEFAVFFLTLLFTTAPVFMLPDMMSPLRIVSGVVVSDWDVIAIALTLALVVGLFAFMQLTRFGQYLIAVANNPELAEVYGVNKARVYQLTMALAAILVAAGTALAGSKLAFFPELPMHLMVYAVAATILGGIGNIFAAGIAAVAISLLQGFSVLAFDSRWQPLIVFGILFVAILFFPKGVRWPERRIARAGPVAATVARPKAA